MFKGKVQELKNSLLIECIRIAMLIERVEIESRKIEVNFAEKNKYSYEC